MYKKVMLIASVVVFSGCADIANQLSNAVIDGINAGLTGENSTKSTLNQRITEDEDKEKAMQQCLAEYKTFFLHANKASDRKWQIHYCDTETIRKGYPSLATIEQKMKNSNRSNEKTQIEMEKCKTKYSSSFGVNVDGMKIKKFCTEFINLNERNQCAMDYTITKGLSHMNAMERCMREGNKH